MMWLFFSCVFEDVTGIPNDVFLQCVVPDRHDDNELGRSATETGVQVRWDLLLSITEYIKN